MSHGHSMFGAHTGGQVSAFFSLPALCLLRVCPRLDGEHQSPGDPDTPMPSVDVSVTVASRSSFVWPPLLEEFESCIPRCRCINPSAKRVDEYAQRPTGRATAIAAWAAA